MSDDKEQLDIIEIAEKEIEIFDRPSIGTAQGLIDELKKVRLELSDPILIVHNKNDDTNIVEIVPKDFPKWAQDAFDQGQFFRVTVEKVNDLESINRKMVDCVRITRNAKESIYNELKGGNREYERMVLDTFDNLFTEIKQLAKGES